MRMLVVLALMVPTLTAGNTMPSLVGVIKKINRTIADTDLKRVSKELQIAENLYHVDRKLLAAVIAVESRFDNSVVGGLGELGYMQLRPEFHGTAIDNSTVNILKGAQYLSGLKRVFYPTYKDFRWLEHYNQGPHKKPKKFPYTKKVLAYYRQFGGLL